MSHCIWGLLSVRQLEFVHVSGYTRKLKGQSLYQLIHQEELLLARRDITKFITENKFGGSITRCRIRDFTCRSDWLIMDIILYVATKDLLLCFLHRQDTKGECTILNEQEAVMNIRENLTHQEQLLSPSLSTSSSLSSNNSEEVETFHLPYQYFHIINNKYKSVLLTWPDYYPNDNTTILDDRFSPQRTSCLCCVQPPPRLNSLGQRVQTLKIHHGPLTFILFNVKLNSGDSFVVSSQQRKPVKHYQPYFIDPPSNKQQQYQRCQSCGTDSSPEWRRGPTGHKTLCNACGLRYSRSVVRQEKLARQQQFAMFQSPHYHPDAYPFHH